MGAISRSTEYYKTVIEMQLEIKTYKARLNDYIKERNNLIDMAGPGEVKGVCYDQERVKGGGKQIDDMWMLIRIGQLSTYINRTRSIIQDKEKVLQQLRTAGAKAADKLNDVQKKIFIIAWIDNNSDTINNRQILSELHKQGIYITIGTLTNKKTEINKILNEIKLTSVQ